MNLTIKEHISTETVEKKSKFIADLFYVESREEAETIIRKISKQYHDARHHCYAYRILENDGIIEKASDDGEPSGTAGAPMLTILAKQNMVNAVIDFFKYWRYLVIVMVLTLLYYLMGLRMGALEKNNFMESILMCHLSLLFVINLAKKIIKDLF